jgi:hypothetical protein
MGFERSGRAIEAGFARFKMIAFIFSREGFRKRRRVETGTDQSRGTDGWVRRIQNVRNFARAGGVSDDRRSLSSRTRTEIKAAVLLPGQPGPQNRTIRNVAPGPNRSRRDWQRQNPHQDEDQEAADVHRTGPGHAEIAPLFSVERTIGVKSIV